MRTDSYEIDTVLCPYHDDSHPSMKLYSDGHLHCYACGQHLAAGSKDAEAILNGDEVDAETRDRIRRGGPSAPLRRNTEAALAADPLDPALPWVYWAVMTRDFPDRLDFLHSRGLTDETIRRVWLGYGIDRWVIPVWDRRGPGARADLEAVCAKRVAPAAGGKLLTFRFRLDPEWVNDPEVYKRSKYCGLPGRNGLLLYGQWWVGDEATTLMLCEGELDALRLQQEFWATNTRRIAAVSATNGAGQVTAALDLIRRTFPSVTRVALASDQDDAGHKAAADAIQAEKRRVGPRLKLPRLTWPRATYGKDITDYLQSGGTVADLLRQAFA